MVLLLFRIVNAEGFRTALLLNTASEPCPRTGCWPVVEVPMLGQAGFVDRAHHGVHHLAMRETIRHKYTSIATTSVRAMQLVSGCPANTALRSGLVLGRIVVAVASFPGNYTHVEVLNCFMELDATPLAVLACEATSARGGQYLGVAVR